MGRSKLDPFQDLPGGEQLVARNTKSGDSELVPLRQREEDLHGFPVIVENSLGLSDRNIDVSMIQIEVPEALDVFVCLGFFVDAGIGPPGGQPVIDLGLDFFLEDR